MTADDPTVDDEFMSNVEVATNVCLAMNWKVVPGHLLPDGYDRRDMTTLQEREKAWKTMTCSECGAKRLEPCFCHDPNQRPKRWAKR
jgi:hypothetical protein